MIRPGDINKSQFPMASHQPYNVIQGPAVQWTDTMVFKMSRVKVPSEQIMTEGRGRAARLGQNARVCR